MHKLKEILRLRFKGQLSYRQIASSLNLSYGVVAKYAKLATAAGITWPLPENQDDRLLAHMLGKAADLPARLSRYAPPDCAMMHEELKKKGLTLQPTEPGWRRARGRRVAAGEAAAYPRRKAIVGEHD